MAKFNVDAMEDEESTDLNEWNMLNSIRFVYGIITTTGTGGMIPHSQIGMIVAIIIAVIGIPLTILVLADMGKFLMDGAVHVLSQLAIIYSQCFLKNHEKISRRLSDGNLSNNKELKNQKKGLTASGSENDLSSEETEAGAPMEEYGIVRPAIIFGLLIIFVLITTALPALAVGSHNFNERFFKSFLLVSSLSFGEILPCPSDCVNRVSLMLVYATIGIILMTMSIEAASEGFRKLHYLGAKLKDVSLVTVWFGGTKMTMGKILKPIATKYNIPIDELTGFVRTMAERSEEPEIPTVPETVIEAKPILVEDIQRIFGQRAARGILYLDEDPLYEIE